MSLAIGLLSLELLAGEESVSVTYNQEEEVIASVTTNSSMEEVLVCDTGREKPQSDPAALSALEQ